MLPNQLGVEVARNPFEGHRVQAYANEGESLEAIILAQGLRLDGVYTVNAVINGEMVPESMFARVRPKAGTLVVIRVVPRGGPKGKAILSIIVGILVIAATVYATGPIGLQGGVAIIGALATIGSGIASLLAPPPAVPFSGDIPQSQDSAALTGTRNSARLYGPIRTVLGRYRVYPDLLGKPFIETVGNDSIIRMLLCFGYGPMEITDIRIGETPILELIPASKYNVLEGWDDDAPLSIFRDEVDFNGLIQPDLPRHDPTIEVAPVGNLTTGAGPEEISFDIFFAAGLIAFTGSGSPTSVTVRLRVEEKEVGEAVEDYSLISDPTLGVDYDMDTDTGITKVSAGLFDIKLAERGAVTRGLRWTVPADSSPGVAHDVRITRVSTSTSVTDGTRIFSDATITGIRTIKPHIESRIKNLAKIELEINASDTGLSGIIDNISAICESFAPEFDSLSQSWGPATASIAARGSSMFPTRNAAWLFAQMLRGPANSRPIEDSRIDGPGIADWAGNLDGTGGYAISGTTALTRNLDAVIDYSATVRSVLSDIAGASRAALNVIDGKYSVVQDIPRDQIIQHFSPRNSRNFSGGKSFLPRRPHAIRTHFVNPEPEAGGVKSYQKDELVVYDDDYSLDGDHVVDLAFRGSTTPTTLLSGGPGGASAWLILEATLESHEGYSARLTVTDEDPQFYNNTDNLLAIDADVSKFVRVRMRRVTAGDETWEGRMFFQTGTAAFAGGVGKSEIQSTEPDWTKGWVTVVWDLSDNAIWTGTIDRLRFDFVTGGTSFGSVFDIESIVVDNDTKRATEFAELSLWGVADPDQAFRDARYHLASTKLRPEIFTIEVDVEHLVCNRGDLVRVSHDVIAVGYGGARFTDVTTSGNDFLGGTLDEEFFYDVDKNYAIRVRGTTTSGNDPADAIINIVNQAGLSSTVTAVDAYSFAGAGTVEPRVGDLVLFGERTIESLECIIQRISPRNDLTAVIEMVEYNEAVYGAGDVIPEHTSNISLQSNPTLLTPIEPEFVGNPVSDETVIAFSSAGAPEARIVVNVITPQNAIGTYSPTTHYHVQFRGKSDDVAVTGWYNLPRVEAVGNTRITIQPVEEGSIYDIRVRSISDQSSTASAWVQVNNHTVIGLSTPPDPPTDLSVWGDAIRWSYGEKPSDFAGFIVKHQSGSDATWSTGITLSTNIITDNWVQIGGRIQPGITTLMVRAVDIGGNESTTLSAVRLIASPADLDIIKSTTWTGIWSGTKTNCEVEAGTDYLVATENSSPIFWAGADTATYWTGIDATIFYGLTTYDEMEYTQLARISHDPDDTGGLAWPSGADLPGRQRFSEFDVEGSDYKVEYRAVLTHATTPITYYGEYNPWPGERVMNELEFPSNVVVSEDIYLRITISGGAIQGKMKAAKIIVEGLEKIHREAVTVSSTGGTVVDLTGKKFRKITNITITASQDADSSQGSLTGEAYNLVANHEPGGTGTGAWELSGPTIRLWDAAGTEATGTNYASVVIEGY